MINSYLCVRLALRSAHGTACKSKEAAPVGEPSSSCESLISFLQNSVIFLLELEASVAPMNARAARAVACVRDGDHKLLVALAHAQRALKPAIYSRLCTLSR
jgi:hypothetical protein